MFGVGHRRSKVAENSPNCWKFEFLGHEQCMNSVRLHFFLGLLAIPATTGRFPAGHSGGFVRGMEGVLPLAWLEL